jgi:LysR family transcriptional activator of nhaA
MDSWLNYHHLFYFRTIANEGSIARASERLRLGQPTLSAQLRQLEEKLGTRLFDRHHKRLVLTEQGRRALEYANEIFRLGDEMLEVLQDRRLPERLHVQLGVLDSVPKQLIARLADSALSRGKCTVSVLEGREDELMRDLMSHRIDLLLTDHAPASADGKKIFCRRVARMPVEVYASPKLAKLKRGFPGSLDRQPFVMPTSHSRLRADIEHYFRLHQIQPDVVAETQDTALQKILGAGGTGLVPVPAPALRDELQRGEVIRLGELEGVFAELYLVSASRRIENPISAGLMAEFHL